MYIINATVAERISLLRDLQHIFRSINRLFIQASTVLKHQNRALVKSAQGHILFYRRPQLNTTVSINYSNYNQGITITSYVDFLYKPISEVKYDRNQQCAQLLDTIFDTCPLKGCQTLCFVGGLLWTDVKNDSVSKCFLIELRKMPFHLPPIFATGDSQINEASVISRGYSKAAPSPKPRRYKDVEAVFGQLKAISGSEVVLKGRLSTFGPCVKDPGKSKNPFYFV